MSLARETANGRAPFYFKELRRAVAGEWHGGAKE